MAVDMHSVYYDPRKILDYIETRRQVAPSDLSELGYDLEAANNILMQLRIRGYVSQAGLKTVTPQAYFKNSDGDVKRASVIEIGEAYIISGKDKPAAGQMWRASTIRLDNIQSTKLYQSATPEEKEKIDGLLGSLFTAIAEQLPAQIKNLENGIVKHVKKEDKKAKDLYGKEKA